MKGWPGEIQVEADVIQAEQEAAQAQGQPIEQVIFDFGNVLIRWQPEMAMVARYGRRSIEAMLDDSRSGFYRANNMMDGGATCAQARDWVAANCGSPWDDMFAYYCDHFVDSLTGPVPGARMLVEDLKA
ncbi:MAG: HAD family phosphatase, partial [Bifidobacterium sp.]|nr:HAD family phosphatase [Bifidobacterium sp.]